ncbi:hypothetical protein FXO38_28327 [Capsicum annuum]|uniref:Uncharacterized protein n=1 Tax=Capsicum annuum TaxID=4072 RepID=A0A2G2Z8R4_CAPAN|nr:hypothetical protein FXO38_28327 [Capsicum annuum]KAF3634654.1 hypothetical protein FXO37_26372 [Capsicum annuum]PHT78380.1 hypothetical protein T459_16432 [Capsicum annuum]
MKSLSYDDSTLVQLMFSVQFSLKESPLANQHHNTQPGSSDVQSSVPIRFPPTYLNYPGMYFEGDNARLYSSLSDMPLKCNVVSMHLGHHAVLIIPKDHKLTHELVPIVSTE